MSDKEWRSFLVPGLGLVDAWVDPDNLHDEARWITVENLSRLQMVVGPDGRPRGGQIEKMFEKTTFNFGLVLTFEKTPPEKVKMLAEAWGRIIPGTMLDFPADGKRRLPHD